MTLNLTQFPKKILEDVYLTKTITRKNPDERGRKQVFVLIPRLMAEEQGINESPCLFRIKRLSDAYCEDELMLPIVADDSNPSYPFIAQLPKGNGFKDGQAVYARAKPFDMGEWFESSEAKGFDTLSGYEEESE